MEVVWEAAFANCMALICHLFFCAHSFVQLCLFHVFPFPQQVLKKICDHPLICTQRAAGDILEGMDGDFSTQDIVMVEKMAMNLADMAHDDDAVQFSQEVSCKLSFILSLLVSII